MFLTMRDLSETAVQLRREIPKLNNMENEMFPLKDATTLEIIQSLALTMFCFEEILLGGGGSGNFTIEFFVIRLGMGNGHPCTLIEP